MTLNYERRNSIQTARKFLESLVILPAIPVPVKEQARSILRHFPNDYDLNELGKCCPHILGTDWEDSMRRHD